MTSVCLLFSIKINSFLMFSLCKAECYLYGDFKFIILCSYVTVGIISRTIDLMDDTETHHTRLSADGMIDTKKEREKKTHLKQHSFACNAGSQCKSNCTSSQNTITIFKMVKLSVFSSSFYLWFLWGVSNSIKTLYIH